MNSNPLASRLSGGLCRDHAGLGFLEECCDLLHELCREYRLKGCTVAGIARGYDPACWFLVALFHLRNMHASLFLMDVSPFAVSIRSASIAPTELQSPAHTQLQAPGDVDTNSSATMPCHTCDCGVSPSQGSLIADTVAHVSEFENEAKRPIVTRKSSRNSGAKSKADDQARSHSDATISTSPALCLDMTSRSRNSMPALSVLPRGSQNMRSNSCRRTRSQSLARAATGAPLHVQAVTAWIIPHVGDQQVARPSQGSKIAVDSVETIYGHMPEIAHGTIENHVSRLDSADLDQNGALQSVCTKQPLTMSIQVHQRVYP